MLNRPAIDDCWNKIGVLGDSSCPQLEEYVHCRNCPVYSNAAMDLLDVALPDGYLAHWTRDIARERPVPDPGTHSVVVFRVGADYMALPTAVFKEITDVRTMHTLPQRRDGVVLGVANFRGQLVVCVSLRRILSLEEVVERPHQVSGNGALDARLLVLERDGNAIVCPVDEVYGIYRFHPRELAQVPATVGKATAAFTKAVLPWENTSVALLDDELLFFALDRSLASTAT